MKKIKNKIIRYSLAAITLSTTIVFNSCSRELNINNDPNNPTEVPIQTLMTSSIVGLGYHIGGEATRMPANIVQHYAGHRNQPLEYAQYNIVPSSTDGLWINTYDVLMDLKEIEKKGTASGDFRFVGISQLLQAYTFSVATDLFGDIPFSQALQGVDNLTPAYDGQEQIYTQLIALVDTGITNVKSNKGINPGSSDLIYAGNPSKWEKFGNSLKLRLYNHLSKRQPNAAKTFLDSNPALITNSADNAAVVFGASASNSNPIYQFDILSGRKDNAVASTIVNKMKTLNDPRIPLYFKPVENGSLAGEYIGNVPGDDVDDAGETLYSRVGPAFAEAESPVILMSAAEINFIKAEVYNRAGNSPMALVSYNNAIIEDFSALGLSAASAATYLANTSVAFDGSLQRIMEQKWITMFQGSYESWVDWRRTGFPVLTPAIINRTNDVIPRRLPYPQIEINVNGNSLSSGPGIPVPFESLKTKVWWDQ